jgi:tRNA (guanine37-N1)-methyltransferase
MEYSKGIEVSPRDAEKVKRLLKEQGVLLKSKKVKHGVGVIFPVSQLGFELGDIVFKVVEDKFEDFKIQEGFERLLERIGCPLSSYDVVGDIAILEMPDGFESHEKEIGGALLRSKKHVKAVFKKSSAVEGEERVRRFEWLAGENRTETVHREHGCEFKLNISEVFFSPRLSYERQRIKDQVRDGEVIVDMFAGVGPYSIVIAKHKDVKVLGYDINDKAIQYFNENVRINKVGDKVKVIQGDCRDLAPKEVADRVIMNLPKSAKEFFGIALDIIKAEGGTIHYYGVSQRDKPFEEEINYVMKKLKEKGKGGGITGKRVVRSYSPGEVHAAIDVKVGK